MESNDIHRQELSQALLCMLLLVIIGAYGMSVAIGASRSR